MTPTQGNISKVARVKQSGVSVQVARVAARNWFQICGLDTAIAHWLYLSSMCELFFWHDIIHITRADILRFVNFEITDCVTSTSERRN